MVQNFNHKKHNQPAFPKISPNQPHCTQKTKKNLNPQVQLNQKAIQNSKRIYFKTIQKKPIEP